MSVSEKYIGESALSKQPKKRIGLLIKPDSVKLQHLAPEVKEILDKIDDIDARIAQYVQQTVLNYFETEEGKQVVGDAIRDVVTELLDEVLAEYFEDIQQTLTNMERVIANALARHEAAITELQNQINTSN